MQNFCQSIMKKNKTFNHKFLTFLWFLTLFLIFALSLFSCKKEEKKPSPEQQSQESEQQSETIPEQLKEIEKSVEKIIKALDGPSVGVEEEKGESKQEMSSDEGDSSQKQEDNKKQEDSQGKDTQAGEKSSKQTQGAQKQEKQDPWKEITPITNDLHYKWTSYMPDAVKKGANKKLIDNFSNALNSLTNTIIEKNKTNTLMAASYLYAYIPDMYSLYRTKTSPEIKRIRYYVRNSMLNSMTANWTQVDYDVNNLKSSWSLFKNTLEKNEQDDSNRLDFSIYEFEKVVKERNQPLVDIKGRVALSNIETIEKAMEKESKQEGKEGQSKEE